MGAGVGIGIIFGKVIEAVTRQPEMRDEITSIQWLGFALTEAVFFYGLVAGLLSYVLKQMAAVSHLPVASSSGSFLITPNVGLMIWTLLLFGISMYILWKSRSPGSPRRSTGASTQSRSRSTTPSRCPGRR